MLNRRRAINLARLSAIRTLACCRCLGDGFFSCHCEAHSAVAISGDGNHNQMWKFFPPPYRHSERSVGIQRSASKSSACVRSTLHQAIGRAKLRQDFLPVLDLRAYARLCGEIARASKVLSNKRTLVAFTYAPLEQLLVRSKAINLAWLSAIRTLACCRCHGDGFCSLFIIYY